ncbi:MAG: DVUA0089 family protein, partial [Pirellulaceae bacterium]|nr:DVUA0089 family protein [Pirellulaceae bacterium]
EAVGLGTITTAVTSTNGIISPDVDVDMFSFSVAANATVDFDIDTTANGTGGVQSYLRLFSGTGQELAVNNNGIAPGEVTLGFDAYLRYTFTIAGTYYIAVSNANNVLFNPITGAGDTAGGADATGSYQLRINALPVDPDDEIGEATALGAISTTPITRSASINPDVDVDVYSFTVATGQIVDFDIDTALNGVGGLGSYLRLFTSQGQQIASNNDGNAPGENTLGFDAYLRFTFATAGTYYIAVSNANNIGYNVLTGGQDATGGLHSIGDYELIIQTPITPPNDADDSIAESASLGSVSTTPISTSGNINPDVDVDMYRFNVVAGQVVDFDIDTVLNGTGGLGSFLRLFNAQGQELAFNNDAVAPGESTLGFDSYLRYTFPAAGTFYVGVSNATNTTYDSLTGNNDTSGGPNATGDYQLFIQALPVDPDDAFTEASSLGAISTTPSVTNGTINPDIDVDMYRFTVTAGQVVDFDIDTTLNGPGGLNSFLRVFNSTGQQLAFNDNASTSGEGSANFDAYLQVTFAQAGTYYVAVSNFTNTAFDPTSGNGDTGGGLHSIGDYQLIVQTPAVVVNDNDDAISEATSLGAAGTSPSSTSASITPDTDVDMYRFTVTAGQTVDFDIDTVLNGSTGLGSYLRLFDAQGTQLASNNNAAAPGESTVGLDAYLRYTFLTAGTFYIAVSNSNNITYDATTGNGDVAGGQNATGDYQLIVQALAPDLDDAISEAASLGQVSNTPNSISATISPDVDVDMLRFTVVAGQVVDFDIDTVLNGPGGLGSYLRLFDAQGTQLAANDNAAAPGESSVGFDAYLRDTFATGGTYYIGVSNSGNIAYDAVTGAGDTSSSANAIGDYQLTVQLAQTPVTDLDDAISEAVDLGTISTTNQGTGGSISPDVDVDMFKFTVTAGQIVDFDIDTILNGSGGLGSYLRLFNAQGQQLAANDNAAAPGESAVGFDAYLRHTFATAGTYYLAVSNSNNITYDALTGNGDTSGGANATGDYLLNVQSPVASTEDLDDTVGEATSIGPVTSTANVTSGTISPDIDVDMISFTVTAGQVVDFDIDTTLNGAGGLGSYLRLFNSQGTQLAANDNAAAPNEPTIGFDAYLRFTFATAGTYYISVSNSNNVTYDPLTGNGDTLGGSNAIGPYQLSIQTAQTIVGDADDAIPEATPLGQITTTPITTTANISPDTDVDMLGFSVTAGQVVDFDADTALNGSTGLNSFLRLFNAQGQELATNNNAAGPGEDVIGLDAYLRYTFATAGTYYVAVSSSTNVSYNATSGDGDTTGGQNSTGNYQITITGLPTDTDDQITEAAPIGGVTTGGNTNSGTINPDIDVDLIRFTVTAGQVVDFDIDTTSNGPGGLSSYLRLFDSTGQVLAVNNNAAAPGESVVGYDAYLRYTFATAGTYYIGVSNSNNITYDTVTGTNDFAGGIGSIGDYQLTIQAIVVTPEDIDDTIAEATSVGAISTTAKSVDSAIATATDVNMVSFTVTAGQTVDFDVDTTTNGGAGLQSFLRLFSATGQQLASNDNASAPGEGTVGFDAYLRYTFSTAGTYYLAISNAGNTGFDPVTGAGDVSSSSNAVGAYTLVIQGQAPATNPTLSLSLNRTSIPEINGQATGTVTRTDADLSQALTVSVGSSNTNSATVPNTVTIPVNQSTATFTITAIHDTNQGTRSVTINVTSAGFAPDSQVLQITDSDGDGHNGDLPEDVSGDGSISPIDALLIINYLNTTGPGPVPSGNTAPFLDVSADGSVTALDALLVINTLNNMVNPEGESVAESDSDSGSGLSTASSDAGPVDMLMQDMLMQEWSDQKLRRRWANAVDAFFAE